jgi:hypothetical protein
MAMAPERACAVANVQPQTRAYLVSPAGSIASTRA